MKVGRYDFTLGTDVKHKNKTTQTAPQSFAQVLSNTSQKKEASKTQSVATAAASTPAVATPSPTPALAPKSVPLPSTSTTTTASAPALSTLTQMPAQAAETLAQDAGKAAQLDGLKSDLNQAAAAQDDKKMRLAAKEFEAIFMGMMFKNMKSTVEESGLIEKSYARDMFEGMYLDEVGKSIASGKGTGLGDMIYKQMVRDFGKKEVASTQAPASGKSTDEKATEPSTTKG